MHLHEPPVLALLLLSLLPESSLVLVILFEDVLSFTLHAPHRLLKMCTMLCVLYVCIILEVGQLNSDV